MGSIHQTAAQSHVRPCVNLQHASRSCRQYSTKVVTSSKASGRQGRPGDVKAPGHARAALMLDPGHQQTVELAPQLVGTYPALIFPSSLYSKAKVYGTYSDLCR